MKKTLFLPIFIFLLAPNLYAQQSKTQEIYSTYKSRVVQVRILEGSSGSKAGIGSGFFISPDGTIVTNYHVISDLIHHPDRYKADIVFQDGKTQKISLIDFDVVHDIAIVKTQTKNHPFFTLSRAPLKKGARVFSMGNPHDLGLTIVEGTFNGFIKKSFYKKIHYTGSINPGMSGGPALSKKGEVIGVNVATAGNQLSFLVPVEFVHRLKNKKSNNALPSELMISLKDQIYENQNNYMSQLNAKPPEIISLNSFQLPAAFSPAFKCWADVTSQEEKPYKIISHSCSTEDHIYLARNHMTGTISFRHQLLKGEKLNRFQFYRLYENQLKTDFGPLTGGEEDVSNFTCDIGFVKNNQTIFKTVLCLRALKKLGGLYDVIYKAASLHDKNEGLFTSLTLSGVTTEKGEEFIKHYMENISWKK